MSQRSSSSRARPVTVRARESEAGLIQRRAARPKSNGGSPTRSPTKTAKSSRSPLACVNDTPASSARRIPLTPSLE